MKKILCSNAACRLVDVFFYLYTCMIAGVLIVQAVNTIHNNILLGFVTSFIVMLSVEFSKKWI